MSRAISLSARDFLPAVCRVISVGTSDRVRLWTELAGERKHIVRAGPCLPAPEPVSPPVPEQVEPHFVVREGEFDLDLLATPDAAVERPGIIEDAAHQAMVLFRNWPRKLAPDEVVREIGEEPEVRCPVEEVHGKIKVRGHAVPMGLDIDRKIDLLSEPGPAFQGGRQSSSRRGRTSGCKSRCVTPTSVAMSRTGFSSSTVFGKHCPSKAKPCGRMRAARWRAPPRSVQCALMPSNPAEAIRPTFSSRERS